MKFKVILFLFRDFEATNCMLVPFGDGYTEQYISRIRKGDISSCLSFVMYQSYIVYFRVVEAGR